MTFSMECSAQLIEVIWVSGMRGVDGSQRNVQQYWSKDGHLLAEFEDVGCAPDSMGRTILRLQQEVNELRRETGRNSLPQPTPNRNRRDGSPEEVMAAVSPSRAQCRSGSEDAND